RWDPELRRSGIYVAASCRRAGAQNEFKGRAVLHIYRSCGPEEATPLRPRFYKYIGPTDLKSVADVLPPRWGSEINSKGVRFYKYSGPTGLGRQNRCARASTNISILRT